MKTEEQKDYLIKRQCEHLERGLVMVNKQQEHIRDLWKLIHGYERANKSLLACTVVCAIGSLAMMAMLIFGGK